MLEALENGIGANKPVAAHVSAHAVSLGNNIGDKLVAMHYCEDPKVAAAPAVVVLAAACKQATKQADRRHENEKRENRKKQRKKQPKKGSSTSQFLIVTTNPARGPFFRSWGGGGYRCLRKVKEYRHSFTFFWTGTSCVNSRWKSPPMIQHSVEVVGISSTMSLVVLLRTRNMRGAP